MQQDTQKNDMIDVTANHKKILGKPTKWVWIGLGVMLLTLALIFMVSFFRSQWRMTNNTYENAELAALTKTVEELRSTLAEERSAREKSDAALRALQEQKTQSEPSDANAEALAQLSARLNLLENQAASKKAQVKDARVKTASKQKKAPKEETAQPSPVSIPAPNLPATQPDEISSNMAIVYLYQLRDGFIEGRIDNNAQDALSKISTPPAEWAEMTEIPTLFDLKQDFPTAARRALKASPADIRGDGWQARFFAFLRKYNGARSLSPQAGNSADAVLSRAEDALHHNDVSAAYRILKDLPQAGRIAMSDWINEAKKYNDFWARFASYERTLMGEK